MPVSGSFAWRETLTHVIYEIPLKGTSPKNVDIHLTEAYLKINYSPFILLIDFPKPVRDTKAHFKVQNETLLAEIPKKENEMWTVGSLDKPKSSEEREALKLRRQRADEDRMKRDKKNADLARGNRHDARRFAVRSQMKVEELERQHLEELKTREKERAEKETYETLARVRAERERELERKLSISHERLQSKEKGGLTQNTSETGSEKMGSKLAKDKKQEEDDIFCDRITENAEDCDEAADADDNKDCDNAAIYVPPPRSAERVELNFTPRFFKTPMRESKRTEEDDWLAKNRKHLHKNPNARDVTEQDPHWLKGKGDDFYRSKDYLGAISAYTAAIQTDPKYVAALSNRAACYLRLCKYDACCADCSSALSVVEENCKRIRGSDDKNYKSLRRQRAKLLIRRGTALTAQSSYALALADYQVALKLAESATPDLVADIDELGKLVRCADLKKEGDAFFRESKLQEARESYEALLKIDDRFVSGVSNLAALHLALKNPEKSVTFATRAIELLQSHRQRRRASTSPGVTLSAPLLVTGPVPPVDSNKFKRWLVQTYVRRGAAYCQLSDMRKAAADYEAALSLLPGNTKLAEDLAKIRREL